MHHAKERLAERWRWITVVRFEDEVLPEDRRGHVLDVLGAVLGQKLEQAATHVVFVIARRLRRRGELVFAEELSN